MNRRTQLLLASVALSKRSDATRYEARCQQEEGAAQRLLNRSTHQLIASLRLQRWAKNHRAF